MRIALFSDLHNEFAVHQPAELDADVVVLAGDIDVGARGVEWAGRAFNGKPVIYVAGNHEYYRHAIPHLTDKMKLTADGSNVHFLERGSVRLNGLLFLGCTLWSDFAVHGDSFQAMEAARTMMNDYHLIRTSPTFSRLRPEDTLVLHRISLKWLKQEVAQADLPVVVVTHHAPSARSLNPSWSMAPIAAAFASELAAWIETSPIRLWIHGHTHHNINYAINSTRIISNQYGYPNEQAPGFQRELIVEI